MKQDKNNKDFVNNNHQTYTRGEETERRVELMLVKDERSVFRVPATFIMHIFPVKQRDTIQYVDYIDRNQRNEMNKFCKTLNNDKNQYKSQRIIIGNVIPKVKLTKIKTTEIFGRY